MKNKQKHGLFDQLMNTQPRFKVSAESGTTRQSRIHLDTCRDETDIRYGIMHELG